MKHLYIILFLLVVGGSSLFSQQFVEKEKQVEVLETTEVETRKTSVGVAGGIVQYFGEYNSEMGLDYGLLFRNHINNKFDITYSFHLGEMLYKDSADLSQKTSYYGINGIFKLNLIEAFTKKEKYGLVSPYVGAGLGALVSKAPHYSISQYVDFYIPVAVGVDFNVSDNFIVGLNATGRILFSDEWDNNNTSGGNDILFNPSLSLKYVFAKKKTTKQVYVTKTIKYKEEIAEKENLGKYEEKEIESFVEVSVKEIRDSSIVTTQVTSQLTEEKGENNSVNTTVNIKEIEGTEVEVKKENTATVTKEEVKKETTSVKKEEVKKENTSTVKKEEVKKEVNSSSQDYLFYTVQLGTYPTAGYDLKGTKHDFEFFNKVLNKYNYCKGFFGSYGEANDLLNEIKANGDSGFVIAIYKDERLKTYTANNMIKSGEVKVDVDAAKETYLK